MLQSYLTDAARFTSLVRPFCCKEVTGFEDEISLTVVQGMASDRWLLVRGSRKIQNDPV